MRTISKFTCKEDKDGWWYVYDRDGVFWSTHPTEEGARIHCAEWNKDAAGIRFWQKKEANKRALKKAIGEIEIEMREHGKIRNS